MRRAQLFLSLPFLALMISLGAGAIAPALADPLEGLWQTAPQEDGSIGFVRIAPCGPALCGVLVRGINAAGETATEGGAIGKHILRDMAPREAGRYEGGTIWSPDRDKTYAAKLRLSGDTLAVSGCLLGICRDGGAWRRVK